jgi:hypothetical protein
MCVTSEIPLDNSHHSPPKKITPFSQTHCYGVIENNT